MTSREDEIKAIRETIHGLKTKPMDSREVDRFIKETGDKWLADVLKYSEENDPQLKFFGIPKGKSGVMMAKFVYYLVTKWFIDYELHDSPKINPVTLKGTLDNMKYFAEKALEGKDWEADLLYDYD